jgi:hypothetical protein
LSREKKRKINENLLLGEQVVPDKCVFGIHWRIPYISITALKQVMRKVKLLL